MSKCHPDKKKLRRRIQNESKKEIAEYRKIVDYKNSVIEENEIAINKLEMQIEDLRIAVRDLGNDHRLRYKKAADDGTMLSFVRIRSDQLEFEVRARTISDAERYLVREIATDLIKRGVVRIEEVEPRSEYDKKCNCVTVSARIDVIPWYKCVDKQKGLVMMPDELLFNAGQAYLNGENWRPFE